MYIKSKLKMMRKLDLDFWYLTYYRKRKNKFFIYFKISMLTKTRDYYYSRFLFFTKEEPLEDQRVEVPLSKILKKRFGILLSDNYKNNLVNSCKFAQKNIKFFRLFRYKRLKKVKNIFFKLFYKHLKFKYADAIFALTNAFKLYRRKREKFFMKFKKYIKCLTLYYSRLSIKKLKRFGKLMKKNKTGTLNLFITKLEFRLESILIRLGLGTKFWCYNYIKSKQILVSDEIISFANHVVKFNDYINFIDYLGIKKRLIANIARKLFFAQPPYYMEINYRTLTVFLISKFLTTDAIPFPFIFIQSKILAGFHTVLWGW